MALFRRYRVSRNSSLYLKTDYNLEVLASGRQKRSLMRELQLCGILQKSVFHPIERVEPGH